MYYQIEPVKSLDLGLDFNDTLAENRYKLRLSLDIQRPDSEVNFMSKSGDCNYLAGVSKNTVYLWSLKPFFLMCAIRSGKTKLLGEAISIFWKPKSYDFFILYDGGHICEYELFVRSEKRMEYIFQKDEYFVNGSGEGKGIILRGIKQKQVYSIPVKERILKGVGVDSAIIVTTNKRIIYFDWHLKVIASLKSKSINGDDKDIMVNKLVGLEGNGIGALLVMEDKKVFYIKIFLEKVKNSTEISRKAKIMDVSTIFKGGKIVRIDYSKRMKVLSVGYESGGLDLYEVEEASIKHIKAVKISADSDVPNTHAISAVKWTENGGALSVAIENKIYIYSTMGHKILMQELESHSGIQSVIWGKESEELLVFSGHSVITTGFSIPLMRLCVSSGRSAKVLEDGDRMLLVGNDKILVHRVDFQQQYDLLQRDYGWDLINIPPEYVQENWPIRYAEISKDGKRVVVAGTRGFVIYDYNVAKWKLFLSKAQEKMIECNGGMSFFKHYLVFSCVNHYEKKQNQIIFFDIKRQLELNNNISALLINNQAKEFRIHENLMYVYTESNIITQFMLVDSGGILQAFPLCNISLEQLVANPYNVVKIRCIEKIPGSQSVVVALQEGINIKIVHHSGSSGDKTPFTEVKIRNKAEAFGIVSIKNLDNNPTIWWYDGDTLNSAALSMKHFQSPDIEKPATSQVLEMRQLSECGYSGLEFYPTTLSSQRGLIIGLEHTQAIRNSFVGGFTPVRCKTIFFLSDIVRFIFMSRPLEAAVQACSSYLGYPYFNICLEMLLLDSISSDSEKLEQVVSFISKFKVFHQVIAHTARKTEMKLWAMLFKYTNTPSEIFLDCLNKNDVKTAMQLLIVLHNMESTDVFEYLSLCLLDCAERNHDGVACLEILTFVKQLKQNDTFGYLDGLV